MNSQFHSIVIILCYVYFIASNNLLHTCNMCILFKIKKSVFTVMNQLSNVYDEEMDAKTYVLFRANINYAEAKQ